MDRACSSCGAGYPSGVFAQYPPPRGTEDVANTTPVALTEEIVDRPLSATCRSRIVGPLLATTAITTAAHPAGERLAGEAGVASQPLGNGIGRSESLAFVVAAERA